MELDNTRIQTYKNCPRLYFWQYVRGYQPKVLQEALFEGTLVHEGIDKILHGKIEDVLTSIKVIYEKQLLGASVEDIETIDYSYTRAKAYLHAYGIHYAEDINKYNILHIEDRLDVPIGFHVFYIKPDAVLQDKSTDEIVLMEHKTAGSITASYLERLALDTQITSYVYALSKHSKRPNRIIYDVIRKTKSKRKKDETWDQFEERLVQTFVDKPDEVFYREDLLRDDISLLDFEDQLASIFKDISCKTSKSQFYQNTSKCTDWAGCKFLPLCVYGEDNAKGAYNALY